MSAMYAVYHGPSGISKIAKRVHNAALILAEGKSLNSWKLFYNTNCLKSIKPKIFVNVEMLISKKTI